MYSRDTQYLLCKTAADYKACHGFFKAESAHPACRMEGLPPYAYEKIESPTIRAIRHGQVVGVISTRRSPKYGWAANPCHVAYDLKNHVPVLLRLISHYEDTLHAMGVTEYKILMPSYKPSGVKIFEDLKDAKLFNQSHDKRLNIYLVQIPKG